MNVRNANEKPEKKEMKGEVSEEKGAEKRENPAKKFGRYFVATTAVVAALGLSACGLDGTGRRTLDFDSRSDVPADNALEGFEDSEDVESEVADVPEELDVPDVEMDVADEDVASDVEDVSEDTAGEDVSEDVESEDVLGEDAVSEDVTEEDVESEDILEEDTVEEDVSMDTVVDTSADTVDEEVTDVAEEDVVAYCDPVDATRPIIISSGSVVEVGGIGVRYNGTDSSGNGLFDILCGEDVVRSGIAVADDTSHTEDVSEYGFRVTLNPSSVSPGDSRVRITVDAY